MAVPAVGVRVLAAFLLGACLLGCISRSSCPFVGIEPLGTTVAFDLRQVLANGPGHVVVWACLDEDCVPHIGPSYRWTYFEVTDEALTDPEPVVVRVIVRDTNQGRVVFDHATRLVQLDERHPNGPGCEPTYFEAVVRATPEGDLIQQ